MIELNILQVMALVLLGAFLGKVVIVAVDVIRDRLRKPVPPCTTVYLEDPCARRHNRAENVPGEICETCRVPRKLLRELARPGDVHLLPAGFDVSYGPRP